MNKLKFVIFLVSLFVLLFCFGIFSLAQEGDKSCEGEYTDCFWFCGEKRDFVSCRIGCENSEKSCLSGCPKAKEFEEGWAEAVKCINACSIKGGECGIQCQKAYDNALRDTPYYGASRPYERVGGVLQPYDYDGCVAVCKGDYDTCCAHEEIERMKEIQKMLEEEKGKVKEEPKPESKEQKEEIKKKLAGKKVVVIKAIRGEAELDRECKDIWYIAEEGSILGEGDYLSTGFDSEVDLVLPDGTEVTIRELTQFRLDKLLYTENLHETIVHLRMGSIKSTIHLKGGAVMTDFKVVTPTATVCIRGTTFSVKYDDKTKLTEVFVEKGEVVVTDKEEKNEVIVGKNEYTSVAEGELPREPIPASQIEKEDKWWEEEKRLSFFLWIIIGLVIVIVGIVIILIKKKIKGLKDKN